MNTQVGALVRSFYCGSWTLPFEKPQPIHVVLEKWIAVFLSKDGVLRDWEPSLDADCAQIVLDLKLRTCLTLTQVYGPCHFRACSLARVNA